MFAHFRNAVLALLVPAALAVLWAWDQILSQIASTAFGDSVQPVVSWIVAHLAAFLVTYGLLYAAYSAGRYVRRKEPKFVAIRIARNIPPNLKGAACLLVKNLGDESGNHIVKVLGVRRLRDGADVSHGLAFPKALTTIARMDSDESSRFWLGHNEEKHVFLCYRDGTHPVLKLEHRHEIHLMERDEFGFVVRVGLYASTSSEYFIRLHIEENNLTVTLLSGAQLKAVSKWWKQWNEKSTRRVKQSLPVTTHGQTPAPP